MELEDMLQVKSVETESWDLHDTPSNDTAPGKHVHKNTLAYAHFVIGTYILVSNALVIVAVGKYDYLKTRANIYIVSLAGTDICVGLMELVVGLHNHSVLSDWFDRTGMACVSMFSFAFFSVACSMFNMVLIALDRLLYIMKPFYYTRKVTSKRVKLTIVVVWMLAFAWGSLPLFINRYDYEDAECTMQAAIPKEYRSYANVPLLFAGAMTTGVVYILIARKALEHKRAIYKSIPGALPGSAMADNTDMSDAAKSAINTMKSNMKTLKLFWIVFGLLVICWFPYYILEFASGQLVVPDAVYRASTALGFLNSGMNFFVYPLYNKSFRRAMRHMVCPCCPGPERHASLPTLVSVAKEQSQRPGAPPRPFLSQFVPPSPPPPEAHRAHAVRFSIISEGAISTLVDDGTTQKDMEESVDAPLPWRKHSAGRGFSAQGPGLSSDTAPVKPSAESTITTISASAVPPEISSKDFSSSQSTASKQSSHKAESERSKNEIPLNLSFDKAESKIPSKSEIPSKEIPSKSEISSKKISSKGEILSKEIPSKGEIPSKEIPSKEIPSKGEIPSKEIPSKGEIPSKEIHSKGEILPKTSFHRVESQKPSSPSVHKVASETHPKTSVLTFFSNTILKAVTSATESVSKPAIGVSSATDRKDKVSVTLSRCKSEVDPPSVSSSSSGSSS